MVIQNLLLITSRYPSPRYPGDGAFVQQFVTALSRLGVNCIVIHPTPWHTQINKGRKGIGTDSSDEIILRPRYFSFSSRQFGPFNTGPLTQWTFDAAVRNAVQFLGFQPDAIYGHFLFLSGTSAVRLGRALSKPTFIGVGESNLKKFKPPTLNRFRRDFFSCNGFVSVSTPNKNFLIQKLGYSGEKIGVFANGINKSLFFPRDKDIVRTKLGIPKDLFIVAYVGTFSHNKGVLRVSQAVTDLENTGTIFIGSGPLKPLSGRIVFNGQLPHERVPEVLAAADVFVLPTLSEGCSNAILEAMACGLPVISSDADFNDEILNDSVSIRVDPQDITAIRAAIVKLRDDPALRETMSENALIWSSKFDIDLRAKRILEWMTKQAG